MMKLLSATPALWLVLLVPTILPADTTWQMVASPHNDLVRVLTQAGANITRFDDAATAVARAAPGTGLLVLADAYPQHTTRLSSEFYDQAQAKQLRLFVEYPSFVPGVTLGEPQTLKTGHWGNILERTVVASDGFGASLQRHRIVMIHDCHYLPAEVQTSHLVVAQVAGYDDALFGLPAQDVRPVMFEHAAGAILVSTTKLSQFVTARYAPQDAWEPIWRMILQWLEPQAELPSLQWQPTVRPTFERYEPLPNDVERVTLQRGAEWYRKSGLLVSASWQSLYDRPSNQGPPTADWPDGHRAAPAAHRILAVAGAGNNIAPGDGSLGLLEGLRSKIYHDGSQPVLWWRRADNVAESAGALALAGCALQQPEFARIGSNLANWLTQASRLYQGPFVDPDHAAFGLAGWNDVPGYFAGANGYDQLWGDDNARAWLGLLRTARALRTDRFDERLAQQLLAMIRLTGRTGFIVPHTDVPTLAAEGWQRHFNSSAEDLSPHYQAYVQACLLWGAHATGSDLIRERAIRGIRRIMEAYPHGWSATNDQFNQERARMLLPLAWLVRIDDTAEHRQWLRQVAIDLTSDRDACGALLTKIKQGPASNEAYGTSETTLIQSNGDPNTDLLYTTNFALVGLHEAAAATGEALFRDAEDDLVEFLCRIQVHSDAQPQLDGGWFRGFDYRRWEYWGSDADIGWSLYSMETGWISGEILSVLALRQMKTSLWEFTTGSTIPHHFQVLRPRMLPDEVHVP